MSTYDFSNKIPKREKPPKNNHREEKSPYDLPLIKFGIHPELIRDCKLVKPYRNSIREASLTLETIIQNKLELDSGYYGMKLIKERKSRGIFQMDIASEEQGVYFHFAGAIEWLRNLASHKKVHYSKQDALKLILFTDHLIGLFDDLNKKNHDS